MTTYRIGEWSFDAQSGELRRGGERRRLEHRAARTLQLLADAQGAIVPQDRIIAEIWGGRTLSDNSVSVVISQLRRLLDDDARRPQVIETVPKRGYRLVAASEVQSALGRSALRPMWPAAVMALVLLVVAAVWVNGAKPAKPTIAVSDVVNQTDNSAYAPLARATSELIVNELSERGFHLRRGASGADLVFSSKLVMWDGAPYLGMTATDEQGVVRWSAMVRGTPGRIPAAVAVELDKLEKISAR